jgi:hypothetical protein
MLLNNFFDRPEGELREMLLVLLFRSGPLFFSFLCQLGNSFSCLVFTEGMRRHNHKLSSELLIAPSPLNEGDLNFMEVLSSDAFCALFSLK